MSTNNKDEAELQRLNQLHKEILRKSGYNKWKMCYLLTYSLYAIGFIYYLKRNKSFKFESLSSIKNILGLGIPSLPIGGILLYYLVDHDEYAKLVEVGIEKEKIKNKGSLVK